jgi:formylmethanofuran dehydrogenase subunit E
MIHADSFLELGLAFHGHKCPAMPLGLRAGAAAMNRLGVERAPDGQLAALIAAPPAALPFFYQP